MERYVVQPAVEPVAWLGGELGGEVGRRLAAVIEQWVLPAPEANPAMLEMFRERDRLPWRQQVPWAGEFAGKYLTHAVQIYRVTRDPRLEPHLRRFVEELIALQDDDGYLGPWPKAYRLGLAGPTPNGGITWDTWGHYHAMLGLLEWHDLTGETEALACARRIADMLCAAFLHTGRRVHELNEQEMNMAPYHALLLLYHRTGEQRYWELAEEIERDFAVPPAGDYVRAPLRGLKFHETPKPRWESLHAIEGIAERYFLSRDEDYRRAFSQLWWSMLEGDRHNNGGFSSGERATGNPYDWGAIETCCTVAWTAMSVDMLRMTGQSVVADELEFTLFNSGLGMISPSGRWVTYDTPMEGRRVASAHSIVFQSRPASPELNCCSVNGPRMLGMLGEWALMRGEEAVYLNYYGPGSLTFALPSGNTCTLTQHTTYPLDPRVTLQVTPDVAEEFTLALRIPNWSEQTTVTLNGERLEGVTAGSYLRVTRCWHAGDALELTFDFRLHYWAHGTGYTYADWETDWQVFGPLPTDTACPHEGGVTLRSVKGELEFRQLPRPAADARLVYCVTEVESACDAVLPIHFSADYRTRVSVNGEIVYDGDSCGFDGDLSLRRERVALPLRPGTNVIVFAITEYPAGHPHWTLTIGRADAVPSAGVEGHDYRISSIYRGPLLLAFDHRYNTMDSEHLPGLDAGQLPVRVCTPELNYAPWLLLECRDAQGEPLYLCDFASAGMTGNPYRTWFNIRGVQETAFTPENPLRSMRPCAVVHT
ncbi:MAG TPA: beta-L-arabinofuranosidase domain-containing protein [Armatimonadota bacterium]|jgi:hypothetical protein